jgi:gliding motility-associated lipoprotein GldD
MNCTNKGQQFWICCVTILLLFGCAETPSTPKPRTFPKVEYPDRNYQTFDLDACNFEFQYPTYAKVEVNVKEQAESAANCWFDLYMPDFDSRLHCTYYAIDSKEEFSTLWNDAFDLANKHNIRADYIDELPIRTPKGVSGFAFDLKGPSASPFQFFLTDSTDHFLRASLYFNTQVRQDSMAPIYDFVIEDLMKVIESFEWVE